MQQPARPASAVARFTCFTSTKVQILTPAHVLDACLCLSPLCRLSTPGRSSCLRESLPSATGPSPRQPHPQPSSAPRRRRRVVRLESQRRPTHLSLQNPPGQVTASPETHLPENLLLSCRQQAQWQPNLSQKCRDYLMLTAAGALHRHPVWGWRVEMSHGVSSSWRSTPQTGTHTGGTRAHVRGSEVRAASARHARRCASGPRRTIF